MADEEFVNLSWHIWVGVISTIIPATLLVGLRFFARVQSRAGLKADDWLILAALVRSSILSDLSLRRAPN